MAGILTNIIQVAPGSKMYFSDRHNDVYPYHHIILNFELGDKIRITSEGKTKEEARDNFFNNMEKLLKCVEHLTKADLSETLTKCSNPLTH